MGTCVVVEELGSDWRVRLFAILDRQQVVCGELLERCHHQANYLTASKSEELFEVVRERQRLVDELGRLSEALDGFREMWPDVQMLLNTNERSRVEESAKWMDDIVKTILAHDEADRATLRREQAKIRSRLTSINEGVVMTRAYGKPIHRGIEPVTNRFADQRG